MKKPWILIVVIVILILAVSCSQNINPEEDKNEGYLRIILPEKTESRSLTNAQSASVTNYYYIFVWNSKGEIVWAHYNISDTSGVIPELVLVPNTYKVVVAACTSGFATICGSGYKEGVVITRGDTTDVEIELNAITFELTPPTDRVFQNDTFNVHVSLDMNNEKLGATGNLYVGTSTPTAVITELKSSLDGDYSITAPEKPMVASYRFLLDGLSLVDEWFEDGYSKPTYLRVGYVNQGTEALYDAMFLFNVNIEDETAHLAATVKWASDPE